MIHLRPYQNDLKTGLYESWRTGNNNVVLVSPTGSGKTVVMSSIAQDQTTPGVAIAHRTELVGQISLAMARMGIEHNIIASSTTVKFCIHQHVTELGRKFYNPNALVTVGSVDTIKARAKKLHQWAQQQTWWMVDECFVAGTLVNGRRIENLSAGDTVDAFDEHTGEVSPKAVLRTFRNPMPESMLRVAAGHHVLYVTHGHPFWTKRGWVIARNLTNDDEIYADPLYAMRDYCHRNHGKQALQLAQNGQDILQQIVRLQTSGCKPKAAQNHAHTDELSRVWDACFKKSKPDVVLPKEWQGVLFDIMRSGVSAGDFVKDNGEHKQEICIGPNENAEPYGVRKSTCESFGHVACNKPQTQTARRKWETGDQSRVSPASASHAARFRNADGRCDRMGSRPWADTLQDRLRTSHPSDSDRSGRPESCSVGSPTVGRTQGRVFAWQRIQSVSVLQRDDPELPGDGYVYNIEVADRNTYVANGVVVHNCHHLLQKNKWGGAVEMFPRARGVGVTATPIRADRKSLHADQGGVFHDMIIGPSMRDLIKQGSLCDYRIFAPPQSITMSDDDIGSSGDYKATVLRAKAHKSRVVGDVVQHYLKLASGLRGITFTVDVDQAIELAAAFNEAGVPAIAVSAKTSDTVRAEAIRKFRDGKVLQLVNVDLFGEGFDVPAVEVVSMARPTMSYGLYVQQFGRALRTAPGKKHGIIIDHVGNVKMHGLPDAPRQWSLRNEERGKRAVAGEKVTPVTSCTECFSAYEAVSPICPFCGHRPEPESRSRPEHVDGDLIELDAETLARMRGELDEIDAKLQNPLVPLGAAPYVAAGIRNKARERVEAQQRLRDNIALWAGVRRDAGDDNHAIYRRFFHRFGIDVMTAQKLKRKEADALSERIEREW